MSGELARYSAIDGTEVVLSADTVRRQFCQKATDQELAIFAAKAKMFNANPWANEIYLVKYNNSPANTIISYHVFNRVASSQEDYNGIESGVIVYNDMSGAVERNAGSAFFTQIGQQLIGGWARVWRKGIDHPFEVTVNLSEYNKGTATWKSMPGTMIEKVAKAQAWRMAYPSLFANVYDASEIDKTDDQPNGGKDNRNDQAKEQQVEIIDAEPVTADQALDMLDAKQALWNACKSYAERHGADAKAISEGVKKRPDYIEAPDYFYAVADELNEAVD